MLDVADDEDGDVDEAAAATAVKVVSWATVASVVRPLTPLLLLPPAAAAVGVGELLASLKQLGRPTIRGSGSPQLDLLKIEIEHSCVCQAVYVLQSSITERLTGSVRSKHFQM